ncbi:hypothetical protein [Cohnella soli]|uniref:Uncharacterized protein n=1 Tax=Cohnella soli TaxID=425005 RepID=A0ABW0HXW2_9BACL
MLNVVNNSEWELDLTIICTVTGIDCAADRGLAADIIGADIISDAAETLVNNAMARQMIFISLTSVPEFILDGSSANYVG